MVLFRAAVFGHQYINRLASCKARYEAHVCKRWHQQISELCQSSVIDLRKLFPGISRPPVDCRSDKENVRYQWVSSP